MFEPLLRGFRRAPDELILPGPCYFTFGPVTLPGREYGGLLIQIGYLLVYFRKDGPAAGVLSVQAGQHAGYLGAIASESVPTPIVMKMPCGKYIYSMISPAPARLA